MGFNTIDINLVSLSFDSHLCLWCFVFCGVLFLLGFYHFVLFPCTTSLCLVISFFPLLSHPKDPPVWGDEWGNRFPPDQNLSEQPLVFSIHGINFLLLFTSPLYTGHPGCTAPARSRTSSPSSAPRPTSTSTWPSMG